MDLIDVKNKINGIDENVKILNKQYLGIVSSLSNILSIIGNSGAPQVKEIENLIDNYVKAINMFNQCYGRGVYDLSSYVNVTNNNLSQFSSNLKTTYDILNDSLDSLDG